MCRYLIYSHLPKLVLLRVRPTQLGERVGRLCLQLVLGLRGRVLGDGGLHAIDGKPEEVFISKLSKKYGANRYLPMCPQGHTHRYLGQLRRRQLGQVDLLLLGEVQLPAAARRVPGFINSPLKIRMMTASRDSNLTPE